MRLVDEPGEGWGGVLGQHLRVPLHGEHLGSAVELEPLDHAILGPAGDHDTSTRSVDGLVMQAVGSDVVAVEVCQLAARTDSHGVASIAARRGPQSMSVGFVEVLHQ